MTGELTLRPWKGRLLRAASHPPCHIIIVKSASHGLNESQEVEKHACHLISPGGASCSRVGTMVLRDEPLASCLLGKCPSGAALSWGSFSPRGSFPQGHLQLWLHSPLPGSPQTIFPPRKSYFSPTSLPFPSFFPFEEVLWALLLVKPST